MHVTVAIHLTVTLLVIRYHSANANSNGLTSSVCTSFRVQHTASQRIDDKKVAGVQLLHSNGSDASCILPNQDYKLRLHSNTFIKGFLLKSNSVASLPSTDFFPNDANRGPCRNSVSHAQKRNELSEDLVFPIRTRNSSRTLRLRYTVVFGIQSSLEDRHVTYPSCTTTDDLETPSNETSTTETPDIGSGTVINGTAPTNTSSGGGTNATLPLIGASNVTTGELSTEATTAEPTTAPATEPSFITPEPLGNPINGTCGKNVTNVVKSFNFSQDGIDYNCTINKPLKQTQCVESCELNREPVMCQVFKIIPRRKGYTCVRIVDDPTELTPQDYISKTFNEEVTTGCQCFSTLLRVTAGQSTGA